MSPVRCEKAPFTATSGLRSALRPCPLRAGGWVERGGVGEVGVAPSPALFWIPAGRARGGGAGRRAGGGPRTVLGGAGAARVGGAVVVTIAAASVAPAGRA